MPFQQPLLEHVGIYMEKKESGPLSHSICGYHPPRPVCLSLARSEEWLPPWWHLTSPWTASSVQEGTYLPLVPLHYVPDAWPSVLCSR